MKRATVAWTARWSTPSSLCFGGRSAVVSGPSPLSDRERSVLALLARGLSNKEIAVALTISPKTVQHHVAHVYEKTGVRSRAAAALYAVERGLVGDRP